MQRDLRILMLEDISEEAEVIERELRKAGLMFVARRVQTQAAFRAALDKFAPDVILADSKLPAFDGRSALQIVRRSDPHIPVIMVTGALGDEAAVELLIAGASDYVLKDRLARLAPAVLRALGEAAMDRARQEAEDKIRRLTRVLQMLSGINTAVVRIRDQRELLEEACRLAHRVGSYDFAFVTLIDTGTRTARPVAWAGSNESQRTRTFRVAETADADTSVTGRVLRTGEMIAIDDVSTYEGVVSEVERIEALGTHSLASFALLVDNTPIGAFTVAAPAQGIVSNKEIDLLQEMVANLSFALQYLQKENALRYLSYFDPLTDLANRTLFCERLARQLGRPSSGAPGEETAVAALSVQCLSLVNDSYGRHTGDLFLQCVADRLRAHFEGSASIAHVGAGEFALMLPAKGIDGSAPHARVLETFAQPVTVRGRDIPVPVKCGLARSPTDGATAETLLQNAEIALHVARERGLSHLYYRPEMSSATAERLALEYRLRGALGRGEFQLHYQPQIHRCGHRIVGVEALLRWHDRERGLVAPAGFLPILESTGLIVAVGDWAVATAAADCRRWRSLHLPPVRVAVNVSTRELSAPHFASHFLEILRSSEESDITVDVEITEGELLKDCDSVIETLEQLRAAGVRVAIDDFGMGYSSLSRLAELPIDILKIDRAFTSRLTPERTTQAVVSTIIALARTYELETVAEGVETPEQLAILEALGCEQSQGYLHSPAVPAHVLEALLASHAHASGHEHRP